MVNILGVPRPSWLPRHEDRLWDVSISDGQGEFPSLKVRSRVLEMCVKIDPLVMSMSDAEGALELQVDRMVKEVKGRMVQDYGLVGEVQLRARQADFDILRRLMHAIESGKILTAQDVYKWASDERNNKHVISN